MRRIANDERLKYVWTTAEGKIARFSPDMPIDSVAGKPAVWEQARVTEALRLLIGLMAQFSGVNCPRCGGEVVSPHVLTLAETRRGLTMLKVIEEQVYAPVVAMEPGDWEWLKGAVEKYAPAMFSIGAAELMERVETASDLEPADFTLPIAPSPSDGGSPKRL